MKNKFFSLPAMLVGLLLLYIPLTLQQNWATFIASCPNREVLSWDANLRFIMSLDLYDELRHGNVLALLRFIFESPTWPPLRPLLSTFVFFASPAGPDASIDVFLTVLTFILFSLTTIYLLYRQTGSFTWSGLIAFFTFASLLHTQEIPVFILSAMLEIQGMFFATLTFFSLFALASTTGKASRANIRFFSASILLLYFTKYPYGIMMLLALFGADITFRFADYKTLYFEISREYFRRKRILFFALLGVLFLIPIILRRLGIVPVETKQIALVLYALVLIVFIDFNRHLFMNRNELKSRIARRIQIYYFYALIPIAVWLLMSPDRFTSIVDTQQHIQDAGRNYTLNFLFSLFDLQFLGFFIFVIPLLIIAFLIKYRNYTFSSLAKDPLFYATAVILFQFAILEILTKNKQLRHIYHLVPPLLIASGLWIHRAKAELAPFLLSPALLKIVKNVFLILTVTGILYYSIDREKFDSKYASSHFLCFTDIRPSILDGPRAMADLLEKDEKYVLINNFHEDPRKIRGYVPVTEFDLLMRMAVIKQGKLRNDSKYRFHDWNGFDTLVVLNGECSLSESNRKRLEALAPHAKLLQKFKYDSEELCALFYKLR